MIIIFGTGNCCSLYICPDRVALVYLVVVEGRPFFLDKPNIYV